MALPTSLRDLPRVVVKNRLRYVMKKIPNVFMKFTIRMVFYMGCELNEQRTYCLPILWKRVLLMYHEIDTTYLAANYR
jgi:hypothetical protein